MKATVNDIKEAYLKIQDIEFLNAGGCLYAALGVFKYLKKKGFNNVQIVQLDQEADSIHINTNRLVINDLNINAQSGWHFGVSIDGNRVFDSNGICRHPIKLPIPISKTIPFCKNALKNGIWNYMFDYHHIRTINNAFGIKMLYYKTGRPAPKEPTYFNDRWLACQKENEQAQKSTV